jgi:Ribosomal protein L7/L12 C-terminal domain
VHAAEALELIASEFDPAQYRIQAIARVRDLTGLGLKESKDAVEKYLEEGDTAQLADILADLQKTVPDPKERKRARDRERQARIRAEKKVNPQGEKSRMIAVIGALNEKPEPHNDRTLIWELLLMANPSIRDTIGLLRRHGLEFTLADLVTE